MSFVTFILLTGFNLGVQSNELDPEVLAYIFTKSFLLWFVLETSIQKFLFYIMDFGNPTFLELLSYNGYKFVPLSLIVFIYFLLGYMASFITMVVFGLLFCLFYWRTMGRFAQGNTLAEHI